MGAWVRVSGEPLSGFVLLAHDDDDVRELAGVVGFDDLGALERLLQLLQRQRQVAAAPL